MKIKIDKNLLFIALLFFSYTFLVSYKPEIPPYPEQESILPLPPPGEDDPTVYWFFVSVKIDTKANAYKLTSSARGLEHGKTVDFEKSLWKNLSQRKIAIGPFMEENEALNARRLYKPTKEKINELPKGEVPDEVNWFAVSFEQSPRLKIFVFHRDPGAVQTGSEEQFIDAFYEQLRNKLLPIGPFYDYNQAELAKRLYRKNE